jgi:hypothetical protein
MSLPGFNADASLYQSRLSYRLGAGAPHSAFMGVYPAGCDWWQWLIDPIGCGFIALNERTGMTGPLPTTHSCTWWEWLIDPFGCGAVGSALTSGPPSEAVTPDLSSLQRQLDRIQRCCCGPPHYVGRVPVPTVSPFVPPVVYVPPAPVPVPPVPPIG